jgi:hypothetical protein
MRTSAGTCCSDCIKIAGGSIAEYHPHVCVRTSFSKVAAAA